MAETEHLTCRKYTSIRHAMVRRKPIRIYVKAGHQPSVPAATPPFEIVEVSDPAHPPGAPEPQITKPDESDKTTPKQPPPWRPPPVVVGLRAFLDHPIKAEDFKDNQTIVLNASESDLAGLPGLAPLMEHRPDLQFEVRVAKEV